MSTTLIVWPIVAQVALVFFVYFLVSKRRVAAVKSGEAKVEDFRYPQKEPKSSDSAARNLINQFELPVLFFCVCLLFMQLGFVDVVSVGLAWGFVVARALHAYLHLTANRIRNRRPMFVLGFLMIILLWAYLVLKLIIG